jgi:hypothetical protein
VKLKFNKKDLPSKHNYLIISKHVLADDTWYSCFSDGTVNISLLYDQDEIRKEIVISMIVCGTCDSFGLKLEYVCDTKRKGVGKFNELRKTIYDNLPNVVSKEYFKKLGFKKE